jgi:hypothetical protein
VSVPCKHTITTPPWYIQVCAAVLGAGLAFRIVPCHTILSNSPVFFGMFGGVRTRSPQPQSGAPGRGRDARGEGGQEGQVSGRMSEHPTCACGLRSLAG